MDLFIKVYIFYFLSPLQVFMPYTIIIHQYTYNNIYLLNYEYNNREYKYTVQEVV